MTTDLHEKLSNPGMSHKRHCPAGWESELVAGGVVRSAQG